MKNRYFRNKSRLILIFCMIAVASLVVRGLLEYDFHQTALLYVGVPFVISLFLILARSSSDSANWKQRYLNGLIDAFIIMLGSSVVLFEGFLCVAMFIPIYLIVILLVFVIDYLSRRAASKRSRKINITVLPLLIIFSSFEGVSPDYSFERDEQVSVTRVVHLSVADIKKNLHQPIELQKSRPWFLHLFPMPYSVKAGSLTPGDVHEIYFRYHRWFFTNTHEGTMLLQISSVEENRIKTKFLQDTSYFSNYLSLKGTEILLDKIDKNNTRVTLKVDFERTLDPYWYFAPIERYGVTKTAEYLITEVIAREGK